MSIRRSNPPTTAVRSLCLAALTTLCFGLAACGGSESSQSAAPPAPDIAAAVTPDTASDAAPIPASAPASDADAAVSRRSASRKPRRSASGKVRGAGSRKAASRRSTSRRSKPRKSPDSPARRAPKSTRPKAGPTDSSRLARCLRKQSIDAPDDLGADPSALRNLDRSALQKALAGPCKKFQGALAGILGGGAQDFVKQFQKFAQCLRDEGIDIPDIDFDGGGPPQGLNQIDRNDPAFIAAAKNCREFAPQGMPGGSALPQPSGGAP